MVYIWVTPLFLFGPGVGVLAAAFLYGDSSHHAYVVGSRLKKAATWVGPLAERDFLNRGPRAQSLIRILERSTSQLGPSCHRAVAQVLQAAPYNAQQYAQPSRRLVDLACLQLPTAVRRASWSWRRCSGRSCAASPQRRCTRTRRPRGTRPTGRRNDCAGTPKDTATCRCGTRDWCASIFSLEFVRGVGSARPAIDTKVCGNAAAGRLC